MDFYCWYTSRNMAGLLLSIEIITYLAGWSALCCVRPLTKCQMEGWPWLAFHIIDPCKFISARKLPSFPAFINTPPRLRIDARIQPRFLPAVVVRFGRGVAKQRRVMPRWQREGHGSQHAQRHRKDRNGTAAPNSTHMGGDKMDPPNLRVFGSDAIQFWG